MVGSRVDGFPRTFGPYLLLASFGRGGMGEVFLAKRRVLDKVDRLCVIKTIRGDLAESREYVTRFLDEVRVAVQLNHAHICQVFEAHRVGDDHCLAMEHVPGVNLREVVHDLRAAEQHLDWGVAFYVTEALLDALGFAHALTNPMTGAPLRIVHRDVSPANVMIGFNGDVKLIDFGLAESALKEEHTETRLVMGKVAYMAPEQARGEDVDGRADQLSAAIMLVELLLGERFYGDFNAHQIWQVVGVGGHRPQRYQTLPDDIRGVIDRALAPNVADRYPTCEAFASALADLRALLAPRAGKQQLKELMRARYGEREQALRDLVARHADWSAPDSSATQASDVTLPLGQLATATQSRTDQWAAVPSDVPDEPGAPPVVAPLDPLSSTEPTVSANIVAFNAGVPSTAADAPAGARRTRPALIAAAVGALAVAAVATVLAWPKPTAPVVEDAGTSLAIIGDDAGSVLEPGSGDAGRAVEPAPVVATAAANDGNADAGVLMGADAGSAASARSAEDRSSEKARRGVASAGQESPPPPKSAPRAPSLDEDYALVMRCQNSCAVELRSLLAGKERDARARLTSAPLIKRCAKSCRGP